MANRMVTTQRGNFWISEDAIRKLKAARHAGEAEQIFDELASLANDIPKANRLDVWISICANWAENKLS